MPFTELVWIRECRKGLFRIFKLALDFAINHVLCYVAHPPLKGKRVETNWNGNSKLNILDDQIYFNIYMDIDLS